MASNKENDIITYKEKKYKLFKYTSSKLTNKIKQEEKYKKKVKKGMNKKKHNKDVNVENDNIFVFMTNIPNITKEECAFLYKKRWDVEVCFKMIKSNFNFRHICKEPNMIDKKGKIDFWINPRLAAYR